jgi:hypothetical protein
MGRRASFTSPVGVLIGLLLFVNSRARRATWSRGREQLGSLSRHCAARFGVPRQEGRLDYLLTRQGAERAVAFLDPGINRRHVPSAQLGVILLVCLTDHADRSVGTTFRLGVVMVRCERALRGGRVQRRTAMSEEPTPAAYQRLLQAFPEMAKAVEQFPSEARSVAFQSLIDAFLENGAQALVRPTLLSPPLAAPAAKPEPRKSSGRKEGAKESYKIDRNLDLRGDKSIPAFRDFHVEKNPASKQEFNAVAVYYLRKVLGLEKITLDHAYTCYAEVKERPPEHFKQSFIDTKNKQGWVEFTADGGLDIPHRGVVFVDHDLPREGTKKSKAPSE